MPASSTAEVRLETRGFTGNGESGGEPAERGRVLTVWGLVLLAGLAVASALHWSWYPTSSDPWYHAAVIHGLQQAGGLPVWDFWEMAPVGRPHIYPPSFHVVGYLVSFAGVSPAAFITFMSWALWPASLLTAWVWMHRVFGPRAALATVILLSAPAAYFCHQGTFPGIGWGMAVAPLALWALESEKFLACAALNLLASTAHPMALFLPPALGLQALLRGRRILAGLLAACVPMLLYAPWLAHIWAHRAWLPAQRTGGDVTLMGMGISTGINLGIALGGAAALGVVWTLVRRRQALGLLAPLLGCAVVFPMGFGGRLVQYNLHWPLACLGGYGAAMSLARLTRAYPRHAHAINAAALSLAFAALATWAALEIPLPKKTRTGQLVPVPRDPNRPSPPDATHAGPRVYFAMSASTPVKLLDPEMNPPGRRLERVGAQLHRRGQPQARTRPDVYHMEGAAEFFKAVTTRVAVGEVIATVDGGGASFLTGSTGRWTTGGMLREVRSEAATPAEHCHFLAALGGKPARGAKPPPKGFTKVFENAFGTLYQNEVPQPKRWPAAAVVSGVELAVLAALGICLVLVDWALPRERIRARALLGAGAFGVALYCVATLAWTAAEELRHPPEVTADTGAALLRAPPAVSGAQVWLRPFPRP
ncbi:MAG: hypothetical protein JXQ71_16475 [Verrucomicrobia bacterium]|nr:hypothetical protein [Verrucomicrobiota bacterium]